MSALTSPLSEYTQLAMMRLDIWIRALRQYFAPHSIQNSSFLATLISQPFGSRCFTDLDHQILLFADGRHSGQIQGLHVSGGSIRR